MAKKPIPFHERPYRLGVGIVLLNNAGDVFVASRIDAPGNAWQMPQGGIDPGENPRDTAFREMEEEIGTAKATLLTESQDWIGYDLPQDIADRVWKGKFRGQKQMWYLFQFDGIDSDINIATEKPEFNDWKWARFEDLPFMIVPFKKPLYEGVVAEFLSDVEKFRSKST